MNSINTNLMALHAANTLNSHYGRLSASIERLSSGLRVNSAADDAAGLAIRELMRAEVAALNQGQRNANDAISMIQVADGALGIIDEKLIRMKELAEQAATGTYDSTQRLLIDSEFKAMAAEIDRIARATNFNGMKLLDGSLSGAHDGSGLNASGAMKIHFGSGNDSAEDYYYINIGDCSTKGLGLHFSADDNGTTSTETVQPATPVQISVTVNDATRKGEQVRMPASGLASMQELFHNGVWSIGLAANGQASSNFMFIIPAGTRNIIINTNGGALVPASYAEGHNDLDIFTASGIHLAGTPLDDTTWRKVGASIASNSDRLPFGLSDYDDNFLNSGPAVYSGDQTIMEISTYNGMKIGFTGDGDRHDSQPNDGKSQNWPDYQLLAIDQTTEDLIFMYPGEASGYIKAYWNIEDEEFAKFMEPAAPAKQPESVEPGLLSIETQEKAQKALVTIDNAIVTKDKIRAHLGALQNRLENTVSSLSIQAENLQASESRISDADIALEMLEFVRSQVLTQSAVAMLGQANSYPHMLMRLLG